MTALDTQVAGSHYKKHAIQPVEFIHANDVPFIEGNCIKYLMRWRDKGGVKDLEKVKHYIDLLIELEHRKEKTRVAVDAKLPIDYVYADEHTGEV
jgi:UDP-3-O-acyl-N-acetylglucosamine deacetylase